jgi:hypothetical protein
MRVLGIDPGPGGFAWASYDPEKNDIWNWGDCSMCIDMPLSIATVGVFTGDVVVVEEPALTSIDGAAQSLVRISFQSGLIAGGFLARGFAVNLLNRKIVASVLTRSVRSGDKEINRALGVLIPSFAATRKGLNGHHRAAAAVAYVGYGRIVAKAVLANAR